MEGNKKVMLSGIQPSGELHLGNYLGAIRNWGARAEEFDCYYFMADMHTITVRQNPADLRRRTLTQLAQYIACGLDPEKNTLFVQSHVHQHAELGWVLNCYTEKLTVESTLDEVELLKTVTETAKAFSKSVKIEK